MTAGQQVWLLNAAVMQFVSAAGQFVLVVAVAFLVLCLLTSFFRFQGMTRRVRAEEGGDLHPRDAFQLQIVERLGTAHRTPAPFCVILAGIGGLGEIAAEHGTAIALEAVEHVRGTLQRCLRRGDRVCLCENDTIGAIVNAPRRFAAAIADRVAAVLAREPCRCSSGLRLGVPVCVGAAAFPENGQGVEELVKEAEAALQEAARHGPPAWHVAALPGGESDAEPAAAVPDQSGLVDELTGVLRSERMRTAMPKFIARFRKEGQPVSVLYLDVDFLSRYNEHYGRAGGDAVLRGLGQLLQKIVREDDLIGRYAGEEFLILMGAPAGEALVAAQRVARAIKTASFPYGQAQLKISASIGVAGYPDHGSTPRHLFDAAGRALRAAKTRGRGRCLLYDPSMSKPQGAARVVDAF